MCVCVRICSAKRDVSGRGDIRGENLFELYVKIGFSRSSEFHLDPFHSTFPILPICICYPISSCFFETH